MEGRKLHLYQPGTEGVTSKQSNLKGMTMVTNAAQNQEAAEPLQKGLGPLSWPVNGLSSTLRDLITQVRCRNKPGPL